MIMLLSLEDGGRSEERAAFAVPAPLTQPDWAECQRARTASTSFRLTLTKTASSKAWRYTNDLKRRFEDAAPMGHDAVKKIVSFASADLLSERLFCTAECRLLAFRDMRS